MAFNYLTAHSPEIPPAKCFALGWRKFSAFEKLINESDCDRNSRALVGEFRRDNSCVSPAVILSVVVFPLHVVHFTNNWRGLVGLR